MIYELPKSRFQKTSAASSHAELVKHVVILEALDVALLEMQTKRQNAPDLGTASANWLKLEGAKEFIKIFLMLSDKKDPTPDVADVDNLKH